MRAWEAFSWAKSLTTRKQKNICHSTKVRQFKFDSNVSRGSWWRFLFLNFSFAFGALLFMVWCRLMCLEYKLVLSSPPYHFLFIWSTWTFSIYVSFNCLIRFDHNSYSFLLSLRFLSLAFFQMKLEQARNIFL